MANTKRKISQCVRATIANYRLLLLEGKDGGQYSSALYDFLLQRDYTVTRLGNPTGYLDESIFTNLATRALRYFDAVILIATSRAFSSQVNLFILEETRQRFSKAKFFLIVFTTDLIRL
jgi:hypothetical protein